jgi:hypothetical protein
MENAAIFGVPRSGTSWLGQIFNSSPNVAYRFQPLFSYAFKSRLNEHSTADDIENFSRDILNTSDEFVTQKKNIPGTEEINFSKNDLTHLIWKEVRYLHIIPNLVENSSIKIIGLVRHPCSVLWSWYNAPKEFNTEWNLLKEWRCAPNKNQSRKEEFYGYEKWKQVVFDFIEYKKKYRDQFLLQSYEELNLNTEEVVKNLFDFLNLKWNTATSDFIKKTKARQNSNAYSVFKKNKDNNEWRNRLPPEIEDVIVADPDYVLLNKYFQWKT